MNITTRAVLYIGFGCNINCKFCYYHFMQKRSWKPLDEAKKEAFEFRKIFGNDRVDITGGEPTIYPYIFELVKFCKKIGLRPSIITNGIALADEKKVLQLKDAGVFDYLVSIHGLGKVYDEIAGCKGASELQKKGIQNLIKNNIPFRINVTLIKNNSVQLPQIAKYALEMKVKVVNFICFNPFVEWNDIKKINFQEKHSLITPYLEKAIKILDKSGIESNVRYFPFCCLKGFEKHQYNYSQLPYDSHEWDFMSWIKNPLYIFPFLLRKIFSGTKQASPKNYLKQSKIYAKKMNYIKTEKCRNCSLRIICDGINKQYLKNFGDDELQPYKGELIKDVNFFIKKQSKINDDPEKKEIGILPFKKKVINARAYISAVSRILGGTKILSSFIFLINLPERLIGRIGIFIKENNPQLYYKLKGVKEK